MIVSKNTRQVVYISSWPKSGSTWLTRLLGDILNSPTGGCMPEQDSKEVATEGQDRPGAYIVRKGHFVLVNGKMGSGRSHAVDNPVVPSPHRLAWENITTERVIFLVRDPRDVCVSGAWHWQQAPAVFLERMIKGDVARCGRWDVYYKNCLDFHDKGKAAALVKYEDLLQDTLLSCLAILDKFRITVDVHWASEAIVRQSFAARKARIGDNEQELRRNNMRKGIAGDWKNQFTPAMNKRIWSEFGWMMERLGYVDL